MKKNKLLTILGLTAATAMTVGCIERNVYKGDLVPHKIKGKRISITLPPRPVLGDYNGDGKYDFKAKIYYWDRNLDGKTDIIAGKLYKDGVNTANAIAIDKEFDGYIDVVWVDEKDKHGNKKADGHFEKKILGEKLGQSAKIENIKKGIQTLLKQK